MNEQRQVFSLRQVVSSIRKTINERYQSLYWIKAEMHKLNLYPSGHAFPELVQKEDGKIVAQINGSIWKHNLQRINQQFIQVLNEPMKEGSTFLMQVKVSFSELHGISLQILDIDPSYTLGELQRERQETLLKLQADGLLNANQNLPFPLLPKRIAIISADTSKGLSDFMKVLNQNSYGYQFFTHLFFAYLQGDAAIESIPTQIRKIESLKAYFDVIVIVRGGGGEVGLACYNNYELCKAIASCKIPILTGIGHSTNLTVAEMIAYRNAITPTELADYLIQAFHDFAVPVDRAQEQIKQLVPIILEQSKTAFSHISKQLRSVAQTNLKIQQGNLQMIFSRLSSKSDLNINRQQDRLTFLKTNLKNYIKRLQADQLLYLNDAESFLRENSTKHLTKSEEMLLQIEKNIRHLDPINVLKRGYSITRFNGKTISQTNLPQEDLEIEIETFDYRIDSKITRINKKDGN
ncbi:MAG TPA: exodeoxyribonuclease VII large subunit [Taishania sp.]|nr:exodeoxyribonuclease VII large subunit [Taishania sp.]